MGLARVFLESGKCTHVEIIKAELSRPAHAAALVALLDLYAHDLMGGGKGLSDYAKTHLAPTLAGREGVELILAYVGGEPAGLMVCLEGFSTFACRPLLNVHDVFVKKEFRGQGLSGRMFAKAEEIAVERGCCKLTLEVLEGNRPARTAFAKFGFGGYELDPRMGTALFLEKKL